MSVDSPSRPEIVNAETPQTDDEWEQLVWDHVDEFVISVKGNSGSGAACVHLSPFTFPGGDADEDDDPYPLCGHCRNRSDFRRKDVAVFPPGFKDLCSYCLVAFKHYHDNGTPIDPGNCWPDVIGSNSIDK